MILVTVGTSSFDPLIQAVDEMVRDGLISHRVVAQIGNGEYEPKHMRYFRFAKNFEEGLWKARVVITCGGAGTLFECLEMRKLIIGVENTDVMDGHQRELLHKLDKEEYLSWAKDLRAIPALLNDYLKYYSGPLRIWEPGRVLNLNKVLRELIEK